MTDTADAALMRLAERLGALLIERGWSVTTAESCTGGWISKVLTDVAGSSRWFARSFVTYSNEAKAETLGVPADVLATHGAVSEPVVTAMARGAARAARCELAVAVSGIAGPDGGVPGKPVGTVWLAWRSPAGIETVVRRFAGDREAVRRQSVKAALEGLISISDS
jgi:nicotinamide-nucleotide amidase